MFTYNIVSAIIWIMAGAEQRPSFPQDSDIIRWGSPALQNLEKWLLDHGVDILDAVSPPENIWIFQAQVVETTRVNPHMPIGLAAKVLKDGPISIRAFINAPQVSSDALVSISDGFKTITEGDFASYSLEILPETSKPLEDQVQESLVGGEDFIGVVNHDIVADLGILLRPEFLDRWLDTPNTIVLGKAPRDLIGTYDEYRLAELILRAKHGLGV